MVAHIHHFDAKLLEVLLAPHSTLSRSVQRTLTVVLAECGARVTPYESGRLYLCSAEPIVDFMARHSATPRQLRLASARVCLYLEQQLDAVPRSSAHACAVKERLISLQDQFSKAAEVLTA
jgi:hypothetical protein